VRAFGAATRRHERRVDAVELRKFLRRDAEGKGSEYRIFDRCVQKRPCGGEDCPTSAAPFYASRGRESTGFQKFGGLNDDRNRSSPRKWHVQASVARGTPEWRGFARYQRGIDANVVDFW